MMSPEEIAEELVGKVWPRGNFINARELHVAQIAAAIARNRAERPASEELASVKAERDSLIKFIESFVGGNTIYDVAWSNLRAALRPGSTGEGK